MSDKLYTAYGGDKIIDLENENVAEAFGGNNSGLTPIKASIDWDNTFDLYRIDGYYSYYVSDLLRPNEILSPSKIIELFDAGIPILLYTKASADSSFGKIEGFVQDMNMNTGSYPTVSLAMLNLTTGQENISWHITECIVIPNEDGSFMIGVPRGNTETM